MINIKKPACAKSSGEPGPSCQNQLVNLARVMRLVDFPHTTLRTDNGGDDYVIHSQAVNCVQLLERDAAIEAKTIIDHLCRQHQGKFQEGQLRTLQRKVKVWRALEGQPREVFFPQVHLPGHVAAANSLRARSMANSCGSCSRDAMKGGVIEWRKI